ncbi:hypothetical protein FHR83_004108 [Actinoplanes campanulatus]|uniref:Uncharacterized protein n=1 Tax=Actinoplanes campanulatus TaxID=113559 RepID=A0A7W5AHP2_9ACTN|nr:hypothetical protein [Actinoplanes campanulatus]MBB3096438.1 hypothetical protein [Actinoplanes campanulatus]GGN18259.1 hypothetical protein GCM10010109_31320 [Actinoplanes campanulatus]GID38504.1 hypothetical protein Aca09nite_50100 [Actinoplanes campanulatus]
MTFDSRAYLRDVVNPLRDQVGALPGDLARHYGVEPGMTSTEIADRLRKVREFWEQRQGGSGAAARVCARMLDRDEILRRDHGDRMHSPDWWTTLPEEPEEPEEIDFEEDEEQPPEPPPVKATAHVERLRVTVTAEDQDTAIAHIAWRTPPSGRVSIRRSPVPPVWPPGTPVRAADLRGFGEPLAGDRLTVGPESQIAVRVPGGPHVYTPFTLDDQGGGVVGEPVSAGVADSVQQLRARRTGSEVVLSWIWPPSINLVDITFTPADGPVQRRRMTRGEVAEQGCRIPAGTGGGRITVCAVTRTRDGDLLSAPRSVTVEGVGGTLTYRLPKVGGPLSRGRRMLRVTVDRTCEGVELRLVVVPGNALPARPDAGETLLHFTGLRFEADTPWEVPFTVPRRSRPGRLRCFVVSPRGIRVVDPIDEMKVS